MKSPHKSSLPRLLPRLLLIICLGVCLGIAFTQAASGQQRSFPNYVGHVNDFAEIVDAQTEQKLETILTNFENLTGTQIAVVTIQSLNDRPLEEYAIDLYRAWGIGAKTGEDKDKGALLLVALQERRTRLEVGYGLEGDLPDGLAGEIIRRMRPFLQQQQYSQGINVGVRTLVDTLAERWNVNITGIEDRAYAYRSPAEGGASGRDTLALLGLFLFFAIIMFIIARSRGRRGGGSGRGGSQDLWWTYPIIFNRGGGTFGGGSWGSSGGSWGSSGGGGGWGGFGGGSGGGGGASDSW
jgi:uncharacterized protein